MNTLVSEVTRPAGCWWHPRSDITVHPRVSMSLCGLTAGRCHVVYSTGITAPNLPVMKTQLEKKRERSCSWNNKWRMLETRWKKRKLILDTGHLFFCRVGNCKNARRVTLKQGLSSECFYAVCVRAGSDVHIHALLYISVFSVLVSACTQTHIEYCRRRISKGCGYGLSWWRFLFAGVCLSSVTVSERTSFHMWPQGDQNTDTGSWEAKGIKVNFV